MSVVESEPATRGRARNWFRRVLELSAWGCGGTLLLFVLLLIFDSRKLRLLSYNGLRAYLSRVRETHRGFVRQREWCVSRTLLR